MFNHICTRASNASLHIPLGAFKMGLNLHLLCDYIVSIKNHLYIGWFNILMIPVLLTTTFVFIIYFIMTPLVDIDGVHEPISSCDKGIRGSLMTIDNP